MYHAATRPPPHRLSRPLSRSLSLPILPRSLLRLRDRERDRPLYRRPRSWDRERDRDLDLDLRLPPRPLSFSLSFSLSLPLSLSLSLSLPLSLSLSLSLFRSLSTAPPAPVPLLHPSPALLLPPAFSESLGVREEGRPPSPPRPSSMPSGMKECMPPGQDKRGRGRREGRKLRS